MAEKQFLTKKGYEERVALLENLMVVRRKEVAQKLKEAREQGDLSENAEYDAAKDEQRDIEAQIVELENILKNAEIIQDNDKSKDKIKMEKKQELCGRVTPGGVAEPGVAFERQVCYTANRINGNEVLPK